jgi:hypothetical protein
MATDIVGGLFGITPEMYQQNVGEDILRQGVQMGQLSPDAFGRANVYAGAAQLGRGISGVMGAEDPQLKLISMRNAIFNRADPNDPNSLMAAARELAPFDPQGANAVANQAREAALKIAQTTKYLRERQGLDPLQQIIRTGKYTPESIEKYSMSGTISDLRTIDKPEKDPRFGIDREALSEEKFGMSFASLTQEQKATVNKLIEDQKGTIADKGAVKVYPPGTPVAQKDWMDFRKFVDSNPTMKKTSALISEAPSAFDTINRVTSNDIAAKALPATLARLTGETGPLSKADIQRFARTGGLDDRLAQSASEFFSGRGTTQQKDQAQRFVSAIYRGALIEQKNFVVNEAEQLGYSKSPNYESFIQSIDKQLGKFKEFTPPPKTGAEKPSVSEEKPTGQTGFSARRIN